MTFMRKLLGLEDRDYVSRAVESERRIDAAKEEYDQKLQKMQDHQNTQAMMSNSERVFHTWDGSMKMLRER